MVDASDIANLLILVGPGFVAMQFRAWTSEDYRISDAQRLTWSVLVALPIFFGLYGLLRVFPYKLGEIPSAERILTEPFAAPLQFVTGLYLAAALVGWSVGRVLDDERFNDLLSRARLDPTRHRDVWKAAFRERQTVLVELTTGTRLFGWVEENSSGLHDTKRWIRLTAVHIAGPGASWKKLAGDRYVLVSADEISFVEFRPTDWWRRPSQQDVAPESESTSIS